VRAFVFVRCVFAAHAPEPAKQNQPFSKIQMEPIIKKSKYIAVGGVLLVIFLSGCISTLFPSPVKKIVSSSLPVEILWQTELDEF